MGDLNCKLKKEEQTSYQSLNLLNNQALGSQLQLTQRVSVPQEPISIIVPIVYDMATGLTQQADIPRQPSSSGAAALMVSTILRRFNEHHTARPGMHSSFGSHVTHFAVHISFNP